MLDGAPTVAVGTRAGRRCTTGRKEECLLGNRRVRASGDRPGAVVGMLSLIDLARLGSGRLCGTALIGSRCRQLTNLTVAVVM